jgi:hypothetical protein
MLTGVFGLMTAKAQSHGNPKSKITIPFAFSVGNKMMPAGDYLVTLPTAQVNVLRLQRRNGPGSIILMAFSVMRQTSDDSKLVFRRYGQKYFFAQAWFDGDKAGLQALTSRAEKQLIRELAANNGAAAQVAVNATK